MSCSGVQIRVRRNADVQIRYVSQSRSYDFTNMNPRLSVREGPVEVLAISITALPSGSVFQVIDGEAVLRIDHQDIAALVAGKPATERVSYSYDVIFTDLSGFDNWILGGEFVVMGVNELSSGCGGGCDDGSVEINVGGQCLAVSVEGGTIGMIGDAPSDGILYGRMDAQWVAVPPPSGGGGGGGIPDVPFDGVTYGRKDEAWVNLSLSFVGDAPSDGVMYVREDGAWVSINLSTYISDAPSDGTLYGREDGAWTPVVIPPSIPDAPSNGTLYGRKDAAWSAVAIPSTPPFTIGANVNPPLEAGDILFYYVMAESVTFPANFAGSTYHVAIPPAATVSYFLQKNGVDCCQITVTSAGAVTFASTGGAAVSVSSGDVLSFIPQVAPDEDCVCAFTFKGVRA